MSQMDAGFERAVRQAANYWVNLTGSGDPNTIDLYHHAGRVESVLGLKLPSADLQIEKGVALVELVEQHFASKGMIRNLEPEVITQHAGTLANAIADATILSFEPPQNYVSALYAWHGCINMAKLLRKTHVVAGGEAVYTHEKRLEGYTWLKESWFEETTRGNGWLRYGVSLARFFEKNRKGDKFKDAVVEDWVPQESPYWDS